MRKCLILYVGLLALIGISLGCTMTEGLVRSTQVVHSGEILFRDDFSDPNSGWDTWKDSGSTVAYEQGGLRFVVNRSQYDYWSRPPRQFDDVRIAVQATKLGGPDDNDYGIICRFKDQDNFYAFLVSSDGYMGITKVKEGKYQMISGDSLQFSEVLRQGETTNFIGVDCKGSTLILYANKKKLLEVQDSDFTSGEVGLIVGSYSEPGVDILFDNFVVTKP